MPTSPAVWQSRPPDAIANHSNSLFHAFVFAIPQGGGENRDQNASIGDRASD
jgi:hypothetical protein